MSRPLGTAAELERRRCHAVELMGQGESPTTIARILGSDRSSLYRWRAAAQAPQGLTAKPHPGPTPRLADDQFRELERLLDAWDRRDRISAISCITVSPQAHRLNLHFQLLPDNATVHGEDVVGYLRELRAFAAGADDYRLGPRPDSPAVEGGAGVPGRAP